MLIPLLPPGGGLRGVSAAIEAWRSGELTPTGLFTADAPEGEDLKKSGDEEGGLAPLKGPRSFGVVMMLNMYEEAMLSE